MSRIREELHHEGRKFTFLCGHDSNLASIGAALRLVYPETEQALELHTPIGSKLVFEKWSDGKEDFVAINLVFQSVGELQHRTLLSLEVPPMVLPVTVAGLTANGDGLYRLADLDARMAETMAEYDAISDATSLNDSGRMMNEKEPGAARVYTLGGTQATDSFRGIVVGQGQKIARR